jgi:Glycosyl hydrolases family 18
MHNALRSIGLSSVALLAIAACGGQSGDVSASPEGNDDAQAPLVIGAQPEGGSRLPVPPTQQADASVDAPAQAVDTGTTTASAQSLVWVWYDYPNSLASVFANSSSFTHVSPALYQINYAYTSGVAAYWQQTSDSFDGLTTAQIATKVHAVGMKVVPLIFAGAGNGGTDQGIQNIIADAPSGTESAFITSMVSEAVTNGYDGYNLDWEVSNTSTTYAAYGADLVSFLGAFKTALHAHGMQLSIDLGTWFIKQTWCSGGTGVVDLTTIGSYVDQVIVEAYASTLGTASTSCPASISDPQNCGTDFMSVLNLMCVYVPSSQISIGFNVNPSTGNNAIAGSVISAVEAYGIHNVAVWPDFNSDGAGGSYVFMDSKNIQPTTATWYSLLSGFLSAE